MDETEAVVPKHINTKFEINNSTRIMFDIELAAVNHRLVKMTKSTQLAQPL